MVSINNVTKDGFQKFFRTLDRTYAIPSRTYFHQAAFLDLFVECRKKVEVELKYVEYYATTTNLWSSRTTKSSLTVHFINDDFQFKSRCLQMAYFPVDHTGRGLNMD